MLSFVLQSSLKAHELDAEEFEPEDTLREHLMFSSCLWAFISWEQTTASSK